MQSEKLLFCLRSSEPTLFLTAVLVFPFSLLWRENELLLADRMSHFDVFEEQYFTVKTVRVPSAHDFSILRISSADFLSAVSIKSDVRQDSHSLSEKEKKKVLFLLINARALINQ